MDKEKAYPTRSDYKFNGMLEGPSYLVSRDLPSSCEQECKWIYDTFRVMELSCDNKRRMEDEGEVPLRKTSRLSDSLEGDKTLSNIYGVSVAQNTLPCEQIHNALEGREMIIHSFDLHNRSGHPDSSLIIHQDDALKEKAIVMKSRDLFLGQNKEQDNQNYSGDNSDSNSRVHQLDACGGGDMGRIPYYHSFLQTNLPCDRSEGEDLSYASSLIPQLGRDVSINCLIRCSRSDYGIVTLLNKSFRSLIRSGEIYKLRRQMGIVEHWVYFSCNLFEWEAYDPNRSRWMHLPRMAANECFMCSDKESLAVGTELLVFGKEIMSHVIYRFSILTNTWSSGMSMNMPRCLFASASLGEIAILAGGCDPRGNILSSAELYNSDTGAWMTLPSMNKARKMCSGVFMDGKFYVIGGIGIGNSHKMLSSVEEFDLKTGRWREIPDMSPTRNVGPGMIETPASTEAPPLVAVVHDMLYSADYALQEVKRYDKLRNSWVTIGRLPERIASVNGWGLAFRACGDQLIVIGGPRALGEGTVEINSWIPDEGIPQWNLLASKQSGNFVYNCAVMGC